MEDMIKWIVTNGPTLLSAIVALVNAMVAICMLIPGDQPEKFLQSVVDVISKFSKK